jgi:PKHD-type hydroxylase
MSNDSLPKNDFSVLDIERMGKSVDDYYVRDSKVCWIDDKRIFERVYPYVNDANKKAGWNWDWDFMENFQFSKYKEGSFYSWHTDGGSDSQSRFKRYLPGITNKPFGPNGQVPDGYTLNDNQVGKIRKLSIIVTLNSSESYDGGELKFDLGNHRSVDKTKMNHMSQPGTIIVFPSFLQHCVTPVTSGVRYSLVSWCSGDPWK